MKYRLGIDVGGTFTDFVSTDEDGNIRLTKASSTPHDPSIGIADTLGRMRLDMKNVAFLSHGSTVGANTVIENKGARAAIITTKGFRDILELRRGQRVIANPSDMYNLQMDLPQDYAGGYDCLIQRPLRYEVAERMDYRGEVVTPLDEEAVQHIARDIRDKGIKAVIVCYMHSYANPIHEQRTAAIVRKVIPDVYLSVSSEILPIIREYERLSTATVNAYIMPIMHQYLLNLQSKLAALGYTREYYLMQSNGGIMSSGVAASRPVYTIDSGPAGGVSAAAQLGVSLGYPDVISFDMGGTTAKVCVVRGGKPEVTTSFWVDGKYFIGAPVMDMVEIGAGGGSIVWIDAAGAVHVGPQSAGADPGPACYQRGGSEATVTDADLVLGYINADYFLGGEMKVSLDASRAALQTGVADKLGMGLAEAAYGVYRLVNANMISAMRIITVQRGYDPRDFSLVVSGGTAAIHAVRMAQELRIPRVIVPPAAGVFSALGLITADALYDMHRSYVSRTTAADPQKMQAIFNELEGEATGKIEELGFKRDQITLHYKVDMRYEGQAHEVNVDVPASLLEHGLDVAALEELTGMFHSSHETLFGHASRDAAVEFITLSVSAVGPVEKSKTKQIEQGGTDPEAAFKGIRSVYFEEYGDYAKCPTYERSRLQAGNELIGPAVIEQVDTTTVLPPEQRALVDSYGNLIIDVTFTGDEGERRQSQALDVFTFSVLRSLMESIPSEMAEVLKRTSYHPIFNEVMDFSTALLNSKGELIASSQGVTVHLGALERCAMTIIEHFGQEGFNKGDVIIHNNPFPGGSHLPDVDILTPVFHCDKLVAFAVARGHHGEIGGMHPGSFAGDTTSIFQEGIRIPAVKLYDAGKLNQGFADLLLANVRVPKFTWGDLQAQVAACRLGEKRIVEIFDKYGASTMADAMEWAISSSEQLMRGAIERIPDGTYAFEDFLDNDGIEKEKAVKIHVAVTVKESDITFDFSKSDPQTKGPANCVIGNLSSATYCALLNLTDPSIPINHGCYRPVTIIAPEGLVVNAKFPSPVVSGNTETTSRVIDTITGALARVIPDRVTASDSGTATAHIAGGVDPRTGEYYAWYLGADPCALGARAGKDGFECAGGPRIGGHVAQVPMEVFETRFPYFIETYAYAPDSGGPGKFRGGMSGLTVMRPVGHECEVGGANDRSEIPPYGIFGGMPGMHGENKIIRSDGTEVLINRAGGEIAREGDTLYFRAPGGGGYGDPLDRDLDLLQHDLDTGLVSRRSAERDYGAVMENDTGRIDHDATEQHRAGLKRKLKRGEIFIDQQTEPFAGKPLRIIKMDEQLH